MVTGKKDIAGFLSVILLLFYSMSFPHCEYSVIGFVIVLLILMTNRYGVRFRAEKWMLMVVLFSVTYFALESYIGYSTIRSVLFATSIIVLYVVGYNWIDWFSAKSSWEEIVDKTAKIFCYASTVYMTLCIIYTYALGYKLTSFSRNPYVFWNGEIGNSTHYGTIICVPLAVAIFGIVYKKEKERVGYIFCFALLLIADFMMSNRIVFIQVPVFLIVAIALNSRGMGIGRKMGIVVGLSSVVIVGYIVWNWNIGNIQSRFEALAILQRVDTINARNYEDPRLERQLYVLQNFFKYTRGGGHFSQEFGDPHNVWLDIYDYSGMFPFVVFILITIRMITHCVKLVRRHGGAAMDLLVMIMIGFVVAFAYEPVIRSVESITILFFFFIGLLSRVVNNTKMDLSEAEQ